MKTAAVILLLIATASSCTFSRSGSQAIEFEPGNIGTPQLALSPANGPGYINGVPLDQRNSR